MHTFDQKLRSLALAANAFGIVQLPSDYHFLPEYRRTEIAALIACRLKNTDRTGGNASFFDTYVDRLNLSSPAPKPTPELRPFIVGSNITQRTRAGKLSVGFLTPSLSMGGAEVWLDTLTRRLDSDDIYVTGIAATEMRVRSDSHVLQDLGGHHPVAFGADSASLLAASSDVLVSWGIRDLGPRLRGYSGVVVVVSHGAGEWSADVVRSSAGCARFGVAVSEAAVPPFQGTDLPVEVIRNGVAPERCLASSTREETRRRWGLEPHQRAVGYIGRLDPNKRPEAAAEAVARLGTNYKAIYVGDGWNKGMTLGTVRRICPQAVVEPATPAIGDVLRGLDCFVLASPSEGMSLSMLEAWHCGCPVVATPVGAVEELERDHGRMCHRVAVGASTDEVAEAVRVAVMPENYRLVRHAKEVVDQNYTADQMAARWSAYLKRVAQCSK